MGGPRWSTTPLLAGDLRRLPPPESAGNIQRFELGKYKRSGLLSQDEDAFLARRKQRERQATAKVQEQGRERSSTAGAMPRNDAFRRLKAASAKLAREKGDWMTEEELAIVRTLAGTVDAIADGWHNHSRGVVEEALWRTMRWARLRARQYPRLNLDQALGKRLPRETELSEVELRADLIGRSRPRCATGNGSSLLGAFPTLERRASQRGPDGKIFFPNYPFQEMPRELGRVGA